MQRAYHIAEGIYMSHGQDAACMRAFVRESEIIILILCQANLFAFDFNYSDSVIPESDLRNMLCYFMKNQVVFRHDGRRLS